MSGVTFHCDQNSKRKYVTYSTLLYKNNFTT